jgi:RNA polymerase sigma-70 factor (ECF subfamily)
VTERSAGDADDRRHAASLASRGDGRAFTALYDRHTAPVYRFALRLTAGDEQAAEDLVHDAWLIAVERLSTFEWRSGFRTWLSAIVVNLARTRLRRAGRESPLHDHDGTDDGPLRGVFDRVDLERALRALAPGFRMVLVMHDVEGYTHEEIAALLGVEAGTSKSQLSRARAAMRRALVPPGGNANVG